MSRLLVGPAVGWRQGKRTVNVLPAPGWLVTSMAARCESVIHLARASPNPMPSVCSRTRWIGPIEPLEEMRYGFRRDACSTVAHVEPGCRTLATRSCSDTRPCVRSELDGVVEQDEQQSFEPTRVADHHDLVVVR